MCDRECVYVHTPMGGGGTCVPSNMEPFVQSASPSASLTPHHPPRPAEGSLHGAVLGQGLPSKVDCLDAVAPRVPPLVAVIAGQVQIARGGTSQGGGGLLLHLQQLPGHLQPLYLVLGAPGYRRRDKSHVLSPDPVLQSCQGEAEMVGGSGEGRSGHAAAPPPLDSVPTWLQSGGQRESQTECAPSSLPSPQDVPDPEIWRRSFFLISSLVIIPDAL